MMGGVGCGSPAQTMGQPRSFAGLIEQDAVPLSRVVFAQPGPVPQNTGVFYGLLLFCRRWRSSQAGTANTRHRLHRSAAPFGLTSGAPRFCYGGDWHDRTGDRPYSAREQSARPGGAEENGWPCRSRIRTSLTGKPGIRGRHDAAAPTKRVKHVWPEYPPLISGDPISESSVRHKTVTGGAFLVRACLWGFA